MIFISSKAIAIAGNEVGNGGDVIVCKSKSGKIKSVELFDFYEAKVQEKIKINYFRKEKNVTNQLNTIIGHLKKHSPKLALQYSQRIHQFMNEVQFLEKIKLKNIDDSAHFILPSQENCSLKQVAIFKKELRAKRNFIIDKSLWDKMDITNQAGLILHEIIYEHLAFLGETNSINVRHLNSLLFSKKMNTISTPNFWKSIQELKIPIYRQSKAT